MEMRPWLPAGRYRLVVRAGGTGADGGPTLRLLAGDTPATGATLEAVPPPAWREREYTWEVSWPGAACPFGSN